MGSGQDATHRPEWMVRQVRSSATSAAFQPREMAAERQAKAMLLLPAPDGPTKRIPVSPTTIAVACVVSPSVDNQPLKAVPPATQ